MEQNDTMTSIVLSLAATPLATPMYVVPTVTVYSC